MSIRERDHKSTTLMKTENDSRNNSQGKRRLNLLNSIWNRGWQRKKNKGVISAMKLEG